MTCSEVREYLFAFLDNELDAALSMELQRHIDRCPECAREVEIERAVRKHLGAVMQNGPVPPLSEDALRPSPGQSEPELIPAGRRRLRLRRRSLVAIAGTVAAAILVAVVVPRRSGGDFAELVAADFEHVMQAGQPVEFRSADPGSVESWLEERTGLDISMPNLNADGCRVVGARKCKLDGRTAAFLLAYVDDVPASIVALPRAGLDLSGMDRQERGDHAMHLCRRRGLTIVACERGDLLYAAVAALPEDKLMELMSERPQEPGS